MPRTVLERFTNFITENPKTGCWEWTGCVNRDGYGKFWDGKKEVGCHRWSYENFIAPIPNQLQIDHLCRVRHCANPDHLELVTSRENTRRGLGIAALHAKKTHCPQGHLYDAKNYKGARICRRCCREQDRRRQRRKTMSIAHVA